MYLRAILLLTIMITFLVAPDLAMAQANIFQPVDGDKSMELLNKMFGQLGVFNVGGGASSDAFSSVITAFNGAVLTLGGVLVSYTILIGTIGTAHDGEMLGKKFSSAWVPIRTAAGTALVLPVINGSYCVMQAVVGWLIVQGIGLADTVWGAYMSPANLSSTINVQMSPARAEETAWKLFSTLACMRSFEKIHADLSQSGSPTELTVSKTLKFGISNNVMANLDPSVGQPGKSYTKFFGATIQGDGFTRASCGSLVLDKSDLPMAGVSVGSDLVGASELKAAIQQAEAQQKTNVDSLIAKIDAAATAFASNPKNVSGVASQVRAAATEYSQKNLEAAKGITTQLSKFDKLTEAAKKDGWILAGAWYIRMSYVLDQASKIVANQPQVSTPKNMVGKSLNYKDVFMRDYSESLNSLNKISYNSTGVTDFSNSQESLKDENSTTSDFDEIFKTAFKSKDSFIIDKDAHPIMAMKNLGNTILTYASVAAGIMAVSLAGGGLVPFVGSAIQAMGPVVTVLGLTIFPPLVGVGFTLSYVLPMMPFMIWIGVVLGWVILCVEAIIAAPMWAVMHLSPHGDDMVGTGAQGYRLVLSLMLRPVLMIFGFIASITIITVFGQLINQIFASVFSLSQVDSNWLISVLGVVASGFIYLGLMWTLITKTMSIIHIIPDQLLQWFGGGGPQIGDYGQTFGGQGSQSFAATAVAAGMAGKALDIGKNVKDLTLQRKQAENSSKSLEGDKMSRAMGAIDQKIGSGASNLQSQIMQRNGQNPSTSGGFSSPNLDSVQQMSEVEKTSDALGGQLGQDYRDNLSQMLADPNNATEKFSTLSDKAASSAISSSMGASAASFIMGSSNRAESSNLLQSIMKSPSVSSAPPGSLPGGVGQIDLMNKIVGDAKTKEDLVGNMASLGMVKPEFVGPQKPADGNPTMSGAGFTDNPGGQNGDK